MPCVESEPHAAPERHPLDDRPSLIAEPLDFAPTTAMLDAALDQLADLGSRSGGAVPPEMRRAALAAFRGAARETRRPARWRHAYDALVFDDLTWSTGRIAVPVLPPFAARATSDGADTDAPALTVENAGGIVHSGATYLEPREKRVADGVSVEALADAAAPRRRTVAFDADRFTALATAFQNCGASVEVAANAVIGAPIQIVWTGGPHAAAVFPQTVVRVGANARALIIERHIGDVESLVCGTVDIELAPGAHLDYVVVQQADGGARVMMHRAARVGAGARIGWHVAELGGALVRSVTRAHLMESGSEANIGTFAFANGFMNAEMRVHVDHRAPHTASRTAIRRAASERGAGRSFASLTIAPAADHAEAVMRDHGLLLAPTAYLDARPMLVAATDGINVATSVAVGSIDEEAVFYVQTRGIPRGTAERMMALAFFEPAIGGFPGETLRDEVRTALDEQLDRIPETFQT